jgi:hypothetical protein
MKPTMGALKDATACSRPRNANPTPAKGTKRAAGGMMVSIRGPSTPRMIEMAPERKFPARAILYALRKLGEEKTSKHAKRSETE